MNTLLRHGELSREEDGAIEFWRLKDNLQNRFEHSQYWSVDAWKSKITGGGNNKKIFQFCTDPSGQEILYLRALQSHSRRILIESFNARQCINSETISSSTFITSDVHSIYKNWANTDFTLHVRDLMNKEHRDPNIIDLEAPRLAWYHQKTWKKHPKTLKHWVDIKLAQKKGLSSIKHDRTESSFTTHSQLIVSRGLSWWKLEKSNTRKYVRHLDLLRDFF